MKNLKQNIKKAANPKQAKNLQRFFKTGKGQYGEGDFFLGVKVPEQRKIAKEASERILINGISELLSSKIHEERLIALFLLIGKYKKADDKEKKQIFDFYLEHAEKNHINNWDLVDLSSHKIVGDYLLNRNRDILYKLARSDNLWEKRISIISTFAFIKNNQYEDTLKISETISSFKEAVIIVLTSIFFLKPPSVKFDDPIVIVVLFSLFIKYNFG